MSFFDIVLIGASLAMDASCVCVANGISCNKHKIKYAFLTSFLFSVFQGVMPIIGYLTGQLFINYICEYSHFLTSLIFMILGIKMIIDGIFQKEDNENLKNSLTIKIIILQAIATSIDALAVGISFSVANIDILYCSIIISTITFILTFTSFLLGKALKSILNNKSYILSGILLIIISIKTLIY